VESRVRRQVAYPVREAAPGKRTSRKTGTAPRADFTNQSPLGLEPREADPDAECGRGLTVVAALSDRWGWERTGYNRKVVWAELALKHAAE